MPDFQTFIAILTALLVFLTGVFLSYDSIQLGNDQIIIPQWAGLLFAGITFSFVVLDQLLRGLVRLEEIQRRDEETRRRTQRQLEKIQRRDEETQRRTQRQDEKTRRREEDSARAATERLEAAERETRRTRIETRYRIAIIRYQLNPNNLHRRQLANILAVLEEYQDTL